MNAEVVVALFKKYVEHVATQEGIDFLGPTYESCFTPAEYQMLQEILGEVW